ncbi:MAG: MBL fold metallo-hydrolase [Parcubacteria group bacterium]|nr:MBL fold metallo-hydrolase [Parcubacteria group bacterium]
MEEKIDNRLFWIIAVLVFLNVFVWAASFATIGKAETEIYFLDVGQGDGEMIVFPGSVKVLIDGGPDGRIASRIGEILPAADRRIDILALTHPQLDHYAGFIEVVKRYEIGAFIYNGRLSGDAPFRELLDALKKKEIPMIVLGEGDKIKIGDAALSILSPSGEFLKSAELNDTTLVMELTEGAFKAIFTGDIGFNVEEYLAEKYDVKTDVLKVAHHGSRYSSGAKFLTEANPKLAVIEVGRNSYGHPTKEALGRLEAAGAGIYRTDRDGTIRVAVGKDGVLRIAANGKTK